MLEEEGWAMKLEIGRGSGEWKVVDGRSSSKPSFVELEAG